jgi:hypothetical protein
MGHHLRGTRRRAEARTRLSSYERILVYSRRRGQADKTLQFSCYFRRMLGIGNSFLQVKGRVVLKALHS